LLCLLLDTAVVCCGITVCFANVSQVSQFGQPLVLISSFIVVGQRGYNTV